MNLEKDVTGGPGARWEGNEGSDWDTWYTCMKISKKKADENKLKRSSVGIFVSHQFIMTKSPVTSSTTNIASKTMNIYLEKIPT